MPEVTWRVLKSQKLPCATVANVDARTYSFAARTSSSFPWSKCAASGGINSTTTRCRATRSFRLISCWFRTRRVSCCDAAISTSCARSGVGQLSHKTRATRCCVMQKTTSAPVVDSQQRMSTSRMDRGIVSERYSSFGTVVGDMDRVFTNTSTRQQSLSSRLDAGRSRGSCHCPAGAKLTVEVSVGHDAPDQNRCAYRSALG